MRRMAVVVCALLVLSGCYHATVNTGAAPSGQTISRKFAHGWIGGLVPPSTVDAVAQCPNGVARVETSVSFVNQLAAWLTGYIYTPMAIEVACAAPGQEAELVSDAAALKRALAAGDPFYVAVR